MGSSIHDRFTATSVICTVLALLAAASASRVEGQRPARRSRPWDGLAVSTNVTVTVDGRRFERQVEAQCEFDERAARGASRWQWNVLFPPFGVRSTPAPLQSFSLAVWRARAGTDHPFSFAADVDGASPLIQTYGARSGSGTVRVTRRGAGARFEVAGRDGRGREVTATIECTQVRKPEAAGG